MPDFTQIFTMDVLTMNNIRRQELRRIAAAMKSLSADLAAVQSAEEVANSRMAINTDNEIYSYHALDAMDHAAVAAADMLKAIVAAASF